MIAYLNGQFLPLTEAHISPLDRGFLFGDGVYEFIPVYHRKPFLLNEHLTRLERSLHAIDIHNAPHTQQLIEIIDALSEQAQNATHGIYLQITRGQDVVRQHAFGNNLIPTVFAMISNLRLLTDVEKQHGLPAVTALDTRWDHCYIKSLNLLPNVLASQKAHEQHAFETILLKNGYLTEGSSSNIFIVKNNTLITPPKTIGILWGITRDFILQLANEQHITYVEKPVSEAELFDADEIWVCSSGREIVPITLLNQQKIGSGTVGPLWRQMNQYYQITRDKLLA